MQSVFIIVFEIMIGKYVEKNDNIRSEISIAMMTLFWILTPYTLVDICQRLILEAVHSMFLRNVVMYLRVYMVPKRRTTTQKYFKLDLGCPKVQLGPPNTDFNCKILPL